MGMGSGRQILLCSPLGLLIQLERDAVTDLTRLGVLIDRFWESGDCLALVRFHVRFFAQIYDERCCIVTACVLRDFTVGRSPVDVCCMISLVF